MKIIMSQNKLTSCKGIRLFIQPTIEEEKFYQLAKELENSINKECGVLEI